MSGVQQQEPCGVLIVHKHAGVTSHDIVGKVRRLYGTRRVGHTGTLDPMATGVLVVLIGRAAKASEYLISDKKQYHASLRLGLTTDTEDITGMVLTEHTGTLPTKQEVEDILPRFRGTVMQTPPMYSALKIGGKKLVDLAREGITVERQPRPIEILSLTCTPTDRASDYVLDVSCSGGTYIRTLCADIGTALGCGGVMTSLRRDEACGFPLSQAHTIAQLEELSLEERVSLLIPTEQLFATAPKLCLQPFFERLFRSGCEIYLKKIGTSIPVGTRLRIADAKGHFFAIGDVLDYPDGAAVKSVKLFEL